MKVGEMISAYTEYRRAIGEKFDSNDRRLRNFMKFVGPEEDVGIITSELCERYLSENTAGNPRLRLDRHIILDGLLKWAFAREYIRSNPMPADRPQRPESARPYIYSDGELKALFDNALTYQRGKSSLYPETMRAILQVTYMLGLRISETLNLKTSDIDLGDQTVIIKESKFYKSRVVPFNGQVRQLLMSYIKWKDKVGQDCSAESYLFQNKNGIRPNRDTVEMNFGKIRRDAGITRSDGAGMPPRLHDLRHTFATRRLIAWYDAGMDVQKLLPSLSTYLGHTQLAHTSVYLSMTDRLLSLANNRFEAFYEGGQENE